MFQKARETAYLESTSFLVLLIRWRKPLIIVTVVTAIAAYIFSGPAFITPKFRSSVVFFPSATNSVSKAIMEETNSEKQDILAFGEEEQAEQMLQILNSDEIRETVINKYKLFDHYKINPNQEYPMTALMEEYKDNINFSRTEFMSVRIDVLDRDPEMAANIANDIAALLDSMKTKIQRSRAIAALSIVEEAYQDKMAAMKSKEDSLMKLRELGVMDFKNQSIIWNEEYAKSNSIYSNETAMLSVLEKYKPANDTSIINTRGRIKGAETRIKYLQSKLDLLAQYGGASVSLNEELTLERTELGKLKEQYDKLRVDASQNLTHKFVVNKAIKAEKKCYPVRWLVLLVSVACAFLLSLVIILAFERLKEVQYKI
ncbi:MAG: hypothetical protein IPJ66_09685 [Bacteroidetes bacterium]|nr:hypothetical protein [Bacteroidota bacterium]MBL0066867.1 hypothetical protein [Bacteroidota bacterium]MBL0140226.1 hypothetical protein [Bacteroidota bacterium]